MSAPAPRRPGVQHRDLGGLVAQWFRDALGDPEHAFAVAEARGQAAHRRGPARSGGEVLRKVGEVGGHRAPPPVDRLAGVADGRDRVPLTEQGAQQHQLGVAGVLVLVQEHDLEPAAFDEPDLGVVLCDAGGQRHLVTEVHDLARAFGLFVTFDQRQELFAPLLGREQVAGGRGGSLRQVLGLGPQPPADAAHLLGPCEMVGDLPGQLQRPAGDGIGADRDVVHRSVVLADDARRQLP